MSTVTPHRQPQLVRVAETARKRLPFVLDGVAVSALAGDTLLTAILTQQRHLRASEFSGAPRAGFCMIGACQDCWVRDEQGARLRACTTPLRADMRIVTTPLITPVISPITSAATSETASAPRPAGAQTR